MNIVDQKGLTALDTVKDMPSQKSREIVALVLGKDAKLERRSVKSCFESTFFSCDTFTCLFFSRSHDWKTP